MLETCKKRTDNKTAANADDLNEKKEYLQKKKEKKNWK